MNYANTEIGDILEMIPYREPFRFINDITYVDDEGIEGYYCFDVNNPFYQGHFPDYPLTPGVILIEVMAQIGLVAFGLHLLNKTQEIGNVMHTTIPVFASANINFKKQVLPGEIVYVKSKKVFFKHRKLVCDVKLLNSNNILVAEGTISGFMMQRA